MKIFVGYHFDTRDAWVKELVYPVIQAFGAEVVTGERLYGDSISESVRKKISESNALIAFATRRKKVAGNTWTTHRWVTDEISQAFAHKIPFVEVREFGVDSQAGIAGAYQHIDYEPKSRDRCLVELVQAIGLWHEKKQYTLQLLPDAVVQEILPHLNRSNPTVANPTVRCSYRLYVNRPEDLNTEMPASILPLIKGGLVVQVRDVPPNALIQLRVECRGKVWISDFENTALLGIHLKQESSS